MLLRKIVAALAVSATAALALPSPATAAPPAAPAAAANPVILVPGIISPGVILEPLAARLRADGHRVSIYQLPGLGFGDIAESARQLNGHVDQVRAATGAARVDLVGHSEGGLVSRYLIKNLGGTAKVGRYVSLGTPHQGTYATNIARVIGNCLGSLGCQQMTVGSSFLAALNAGDDTPGDVRFTSVRSAYDELVLPANNAVLGDGATNVLIQSACPLRVVGHLGLIYDGTTYTVVRAALSDSPIVPDCLAA